MTQAEPMADTVSQHRPDDPLDVWISVFLVAGLVIVHLLMAYSYSTLPDAVFDAIDGVTGQRLGMLVISVLPTLPLAVVVLVWARTRTLGGLAFAVVLAEGLLGHLRGVAAQRLFEAGHFDGTVTFIDWTGWVLAALIPAVVVLAWGLARRRGRAWTIGVAVAAAIGLVVHALDFSGVAAEHAGRNAVVLAGMYHVVPALIGGLLAWAIQVRTERP